MTTLMGVLVDRSSWPDGRCPIEKTLAVVGTRSAVLLMREAQYGTTRFEDFVQRAGLTRALTATRLSELIDAGLLVKRSYRNPGRRSHNEYVLTDAGAAFTSVLWAMFEWGRTQLGEDSPLRLTHVGCGAGAKVEIRCSKGHVVPPDELGVRLKPGRSSVANAEPPPDAK